MQHENAPAGEALLVQALAGLKAAMELQAEQLNADTQALHTLKVRSCCSRCNTNMGASVPVLACCTAEPHCRSWLRSC